MDEQSNEKVNQWLQDHFWSRPRWQQTYAAAAVVLVASILLSDLTVKVVLQGASAILLGVAEALWLAPHLKRWSSSQIGRWVFLVGNILMGLLATATARSVVAAAIGLPPQDFDLTVALYAVLYYPVCVIWLMPIALFFGILLTLFLWVIKLIKEDKPHAGQMWPFVHFVGLFALLGIASVSSAYFGKVQSSLYPLVRWTAYFADFHPAPNYPAIGARERIRLHENGVVSKAEVVDGQVVITTGKRDF